MNKNKQSLGHKGQVTYNPESYAAKLAFIAAAITTLGDVLATIAAGIALDEIISNDNENQKSQTNQEKRMLNMQKQIDELTIQLKKLTKK